MWNRAETEKHRKRSPPNIFSSLVFGQLAKIIIQKREVAEMLPTEVRTHLSPPLPFPIGWSKCAFGVMAPALREKVRLCQSQMERLTVKLSACSDFRHCTASSWWKLSHLNQEPFIQGANFFCLKCPGSLAARRFHRVPSKFSLWS